MKHKVKSIDNSVVVHELELEIKSGLWDRL